MSSIKCEEVFTIEIKRNKSKTFEYDKNRNNIKIEHKIVKTCHKIEISPPCNEFNLAEKCEPCKNFNDDPKRKDFQNLMWNIKI